MVAGIVESTTGFDPATANIIGDYVADNVL